MTKSNRGRKAKYPWDQMKKGDSFLYSKKTVATTLYTAMSLIYSRTRKHGGEYEAHITSEGVRVWKNK